MNKDTIVRVKAAVGTTDDRDIGEGQGQGSAKGASLSAVNLDLGMSSFCKGSETETNYGNVEIRPILFQDDISRMAQNISDAQEGNDRLETLTETKLLDFNLDKSVFLIVGKERNRCKIKAELVMNPLTLYGKP